jgi:hypothetical protein
MPYTWPVNGLVYDTSGVYYDTIVNSNGCSEIYSLGLNYEGGTIIDTIITCDSYSIAGTSSPTWSQSGVYNHTVFGAWCDTYYTIYLTINNSDSLTISRDICYGESITVGNNIYNQTGSYTDGLIGSNGCDSTITLNLTVYADIVSTLSQLGNDIISNTVGGTSPYIYEWNTGETTSQITPTVNGDYWVIITDANGCVSDTSFVNVEWVSTSIEDLNIDKLTIYPNPSKDVFNVAFTNLTKQDIELKVINAIGGVIYIDTRKNHTGSYNQSIYLQNYAKGLYLLEIRTADGMLSRKLILE